MTANESIRGADFRRFRRATGRDALVLSGLVLPWIYPFTDGPSTWVGPWLASFACGAIAYGIRGPAAPAPGVTAFLGAVVAWALIRSGWIPETVALAAGCLLIWMAAAMARDDGPGDRWGKAAALTWLAAALFSTFAGLCQYFGIADHFAPWINESSVGEAFANLRQRNQFASLTVMGMAAIVFWWPAGLGRGYALGLIAWLAMGNAITTSRTGLVEMILLGVLACVWPGPRRARGARWAAGMLSYVIAAVAMPWLLEAFTGVAAGHLWSRVSSSDACGSRWVLWSNVAHLIAQKPWIGWGWGELDFAHFTTLYSEPRFCDILDNAHNLPLHLAVELGLPAAVLVGVALCWGLWHAKPWREHDPTRQMAWAAVSVIAVHSLLEYPLWYGPFQIALGLCLGLLSRATGAAAADSSARSEWPATARRVLAVLALVGSAYTAWDYHRVSQIYLPVASRRPEWRDDPLSRMRDSWLFGSQVRFAEVTITPVTIANAAWMHDSAAALLHFSPEPHVIEKLIDSSVLLGRSDEALLQLVRFRAAFPEAYGRWRQESGTVP